MDMNETCCGNIWHVVIAGKCAVPGDDTILEISDRVSIWMLNEGDDGFRCCALPCKWIVRRKPWKWADIVDDAEAIEVLEKPKAHRNAAIVS